MPRVVLALASSGDAERLARVAAVQDIDSRGVSSELSDVGEDGDAGPVPLEHPPAVGVGLAEPSRRSAEGSMDGKVESADAGEQRTGIHTHPLTATWR